MASAQSIPIPLQDLLVKLRIIAQIERGKKLNMGSMTFIDASSWMGALGRSINSEGRKSTMLHIRQIITQAIAAINDYYETEFCQLIVNHLAQSKMGLANLASTYESDPNIKANIDIIIVDIDLQLNRHKKLLDGHYEKLTYNRGE